MTLHDADLVDYGDDIISGFGYGPEDWGPYEIIDGVVRPIRSTSLESSYFRCEHVS
jgi:hypothetical protein